MMKQLCSDVDPWRSRKRKAEIAFEGCHFIGKIWPRSMTSLPLCLLDFQEMQSWPCDDMNGLACDSTAWLLPAAVCDIRKRWTVDRCTATANVYAPDSWKDVEESEIFMDVVKTILTEGRLQGATRCFQIARDLNIQMGSTSSQRRRLLFVDRTYGQACVGTWSIV